MATPTEVDVLELMLLEFADRLGFTAVVGPMADLIAIPGFKFFLGKNSNEKWLKMALKKTCLSSLRGVGLALGSRSQD